MVGTVLLLCTKWHLKQWVGCFARAYRHVGRRSQVKTRWLKLHVLSDVNKIIKQIRSLGLALNWQNDTCWQKYWQNHEIWTFFNPIYQTFNSYSMWCRQCKWIQINSSKQLERLWKSRFRSMYLINYSIVIFLTK